MRNMRRSLVGCRKSNLSNLGNKTQRLGQERRINIKDKYHRNRTQRKIDEIWHQLFPLKIDQILNIINLSLMKVLALLLLVGLALSELPNQRPIIGIFTQSTDSDEPVVEGIHRGVVTSNNNASYIAASYIKYIQMSGAQVVPIFAYSNRSYFDDLLPRINGVLFPGGDTDIDIKTKWTQNADYILQYAIAQNKKGNVFPVWGTCLGMQLLAYLTSGYDDKAIAPVRGQVAVRNTLAIQKGSVLLGDLSTDLLTRLQSGDGILYFNHHFAVTRAYYEASPTLRSFWDVDAFTTSSFSDQFLSVFSAKDYPFYGVQFHPEKNLYEWKVFADRSESGAEIVQILSNRFVEQARQSKNQFANANDFSKLSIYNYKTHETNMSFIRIYLFTENTTDVHRPFPLHATNTHLTHANLEE